MLVWFQVLNRLMSQNSLINLTYNVVWLEYLISKLKELHAFEAFLVSTTIGIRNDMILVVGLGFLINDGIMGTRWLRVMGYGKPYVEVIRWKGEAL